jgi:hypothetical protein
MLVCLYHGLHSTPVKFLQWYAVNKLYSENSKVNRSYQLSVSLVSMILPYKSCMSMMA